MKTEIGSYEAKTKLPELLRQVRKGKSFTITNRGEPIADLVPSENARLKQQAEAVEAMREFIRKHGRIKVPSIKALFEEGRD
jgi:prevent-host-death family protein